MSIPAFPTIPSSQHAGSAGAHRGAKSSANAGSDFGLELDAQLDGAPANDSGRAAAPNKRKTDAPGSSAAGDTTAAKPQAEKAETPKSGDDASTPEPQPHAHEAGAGPAPVQEPAVALDDTGESETSEDGSALPESRQGEAETVLALVTAAPAGPTAPHEQIPVPAVDAEISVIEPADAAPQAGTAIASAASAAIEAPATVGDAEAAPAAAAAVRAAPAPTPQSAPDAEATATADPENPDADIASANTVQVRPDRPRLHDLAAAKEAAPESTAALSADAESPARAAGKADEARVTASDHRLTEQLRSDTETQLLREPLRPAAKPAGETAAPQPATLQSSTDAGQTATLQPLNAANGATTAAPAGGASAPAPAFAPAIPVAALSAEIAARARDGASRFEIRLDPPELGRVDVKLDIDRDGNVSSRLIVERSETLDLLRRHAPSLERALEAAGLTTSQNGLEFSLRDQTAESDASDDRYVPAAAAGAPSVADADLQALAAVQRRYQLLLGLGAGIDIRV